MAPAAGASRLVISASWNHAEVAEFADDGGRLDLAGIHLECQMANSERMSDAPIAIVEDVEAFAIMLAYNIEALGYSSCWIGNGLEVLATLRLKLPRAVILDWMMPGMSGLSLLRSLRSAPATRQLPILVIAESADPRERNLAVGAGADAYVARPFALPEFMEQCSRLVASRPTAAGESVTPLTYGPRTALVPAQSETDRNVSEIARQLRQ